MLYANGRLLSSRSLVGRLPAGLFFHEQAVSLVSHLIPCRCYRFHCDRKECGRTFSSYTLLVMVQECFGGRAAGGSFEVDDLSSACRATKSLYRLLTVQVRIGVETDHISSGLSHYMSSTSA